MPGHSPLTKKLIADGLKGAERDRPLAELLAEHRDLAAFAASVRDAPDGHVTPSLRAAAQALLVRAKAARAEGRAA